MANYDAGQKQWGNFKSLSPIDSDISLGQRILDLLAKHGSKVAQVLSFLSKRFCSSIQSIALLKQKVGNFVD